MLHRVLPLTVVALAACTTHDAPSPSPAAPAHAEPDAGPGSETPTPGSETSDATGVAAEPFTIQAFDEVRISSHDSDPHFQSATADVDFGPGPFARVTLLVDLATTCWPPERSASDPPPEGHNWPPLCDAFDRNFEFTLDEPTSEADPPAFELVRAITPFGGDMHFSVDVTDLANAHPGAHRLKTHISTWSDPKGQVTGAHGGWNVSARLEVVPGPAPREVLAAIPLLNGRLDASRGEAQRDFDQPAGTRSLRLEVRATGHGGGTDRTYCNGPAEEFCAREQTLWLNDRELATWTPRRNDCAELCTLQERGGRQYCAENPTGAIASVRASRANWCPGDITPPKVWDLEVTGSAPSSHTLRYAIPSIAEGGMWRLSATLYAYATPLP